MLRRPRACRERGYGDVLWEPSPEVVKRARITDYRRWLAARGERGRRAGGVSAAGRPRPRWGRAWPPRGRPGGRRTRLRPALAVVGRGSQPRSGARSGTTSAVLGERGDGPVLAGGPMPGVDLVPRRHPQLRAQRPADRADRSHQDRGDRPRRGGPSGHADLRANSPPRWPGCGPGWRRSACQRATGSPRSCPTSRPR